MSTTITIPSLSPEDVRVIFETTNIFLNMTIMEASLFGIYTGSLLHHYVEYLIFISGRESQGGMQLYRGIIEILVESAVLYSITLLIYTGFVVRNDTGGSYVEIVAAVARGIAPTLTVGRVAAGHAWPNDSWTASAASSLRFGASSRGQSQDSMDEEAVGDEVSKGNA
ncbi:uncharacterized protein ARMOST_02470 [Armillaria ostoyae]|uniref:Uncharacterized protein n=1 Tax=Armillaria ostoyae TaxID=47428 RepID=A0A284QRS2_ARMOS|nr:uncharacterized protein ARMOST_02470 [Armillaria ostoyae]